MPLSFHHLLLGGRRATLREVLARATGEGKAVLDVARALAMRRIANDDAISAQHEQFFALPWVGAPHAWTSSPRGVTQSDVVRALLAVVPDRVRAAIEPALHGIASEKWGRARHAVRALVPHPADVAVAADLDFERSYAWSWTETLRCVPAEPIDLEIVFGSLDFDGRAALTCFGHDFDEGLLTIAEAEQRIEGVHRLGDLSPAYADPAGW